MYGFIPSNCGCQGAVRESFVSTALRWLQRFIDEQLPPLADVALAASALAELRHGRRAVSVEALRRVMRH
jgi:predicted DNA-binding protein